MANMTKKYDTLDEHVRDINGLDMDCAIHNKWHMHIYFRDGERIGSGCYSDNHLCDPHPQLHEIGLLWSTGPMRNAVTLQEFVDGILG